MPNLKLNVQRAVNWRPEMQAKNTGAEEKLSKQVARQRVRLTQLIIIKRLKNWLGTAVRRGAPFEISRSLASRRQQAQRFLLSFLSVLPLFGAVVSVGCAPFVVRARRAHAMCICVRSLATPALGRTSDRTSEVARAFVLVRACVCAVLFVLALLTSTSEPSSYAREFAALRSIEVCRLCFSCVFRCERVCVWCGEWHGARTLHKVRSDADLPERIHARMVLACMQIDGMIWKCATY